MAGDPRFTRIRKMTAVVGLCGVGAILLAELLGSFVINSGLATVVADVIGLALGVALMILLGSEFLHRRRARNDA
jgi:hypothetical protein